MNITTAEIIQHWGTEDRRRHRRGRFEIETAASDDWTPPNSIEDYGIPTYAKPLPGTAPVVQLSGRFTPVAIDNVSLPSDPPWLIEGILPARGLACIVGAPKSGKSFLATDMLCAVARGVPYAGRETTAGAVLYLTGEGVSGFKRRLVAIRRHLGIEGQGVPFFMVDDVPDLGSEATDLPQLLADLDAFTARTCPEGPRAIVLDTLARCMGEGDENSARDMGRFVNRCSAIEQHFGCVVIVVHHVGKNPERGGRGSNALNGAADVTMTVEKSETYSTVRIDEMKDGPEGQWWRFRLLQYLLTETSDTPSEISSEVSTCVVELLSEPTTAKPRETKKAGAPKGVTGDLLKVIRRAVEEAGERNIKSVAVPNNVQAVSKATLKRYCTTMDWQDQEEKPDAFRSMLSKTLSGLRSSDLIGFDKEWVWLT